MFIISFVWMIIILVSLYCLNGMNMKVEKHKRDKVFFEYGFAIEYRIQCYVYNILYEEFHNGGYTRESFEQHIKDKYGVDGVRKFICEFAENEVIRLRKMPKRATIVSDNSHILCDNWYKVQHDFINIYPYTYFDTRFDEKIGIERKKYEELIKHDNTTENCVDELFNDFIRKGVSI